MYTLRIRRYFFHLDVEPLRLWGKRCYQACVPYSEHIHVWKAMHDLKDWAHLPFFFVEKGKGSFLFGRLKNEVTQLLSGSLGLCSGVMVVGSTVERTWSVLHSASGSIRALKGNGEPRKWRGVSWLQNSESAFELPLFGGAWGSLGTCRLGAYENLSQARWTMPDGRGDPVSISLEMDTRVLSYFGGKVLQNSFAVQGSGIVQERERSPKNVTLDLLSICYTGL